MVGAPLDTTRADRGGAAASTGRGVLTRIRRSFGGPNSVTDNADSDRAQATTESADGTTNAVATFSAGADSQGWAPPTWEEIVSTHSARVYRLAYRLTGNQHDAEDLTQEVFVRVFRSLSTYTPGTFEGWLHRITTNLFLDSVRRKQRIRFDALGEDAADRLPSREPTPQQHFNDTHFDADVQQALDTLAPDFRAAVVLCDIEGLSYEEIATTLGVKLGTVRSRIHRGRSHLRKALRHRSPEERGSRAAQPAEPEASLPSAEPALAVAPGAPGSVEGAME
ncbi:RNA polymerase sigma factor SigE [Streptomyces sp. 3MP-14]|uniref:RNA polymerase sigma factor SigE n=1 Tax=Streptomyces mimosae TaxID=2586635 RepID=A0A5N6ABH5_9ACTN|nr:MULTISPECIES: RNA polymerase sigma factor SigE [Streptomyces]KAB8165120.1 RNA polymerase sigma factor SigE [Streptomyces mimosae]KAB8175752.1 RNA polymerase sigma factor SigE [Streptomyces sp. 3MP-14]